MNADTVLHQRIVRLTPLAEVLAAFDRIEPVAPRNLAVADASRCVLAADVVAQKTRPATPVAVRDGWAVESEATRDAGPYAPLALQPCPERLDAFDALLPGTDAVAPLDAVTAQGSQMQVIEPVAPGEGVLPAGGDVDAGTVLRGLGQRLRMTDIAVMAATGVATVSIRQPVIHVVNAKAEDRILDSASSLICDAVVAAGARADRASDLEQALRSDDADALIAIGGTGSGRHDRSVITLSQAGSVTCHGIGLAPGETAAFGTVGRRPVLLMPGRIDAVLACWLVLGRRLSHRLGGAQHEDIAMPATLARKVTSAVGIAEVILLRRGGGDVEPLGSGYLSLQSLARADGWMLVPAESEGYPAGTIIDMRPLP